MWAPRSEWVELCAEGVLEGVEAESAKSFP